MPWKSKKKKNPSYTLYQKQPSHSKNNFLIIRQVLSIFKDFFYSAMQCLKVNVPPYNIFSLNFTF